MASGSICVLILLVQEEKRVDFIYFNQINDMNFM